MNRKLAVIDIKAAAVFLAAAVISSWDEKSPLPEVDDEEQAKKYLKSPILEELEKLALPGYRAVAMEKTQVAAVAQPNISTADGRAAELQGLHSGLKDLLNRLDRLNGPREFSQAATHIGEAFMLLTPLIQDAKGEAITQRELPSAEHRDVVLIKREPTEEEIESVRKNAGEQSGLMSEEEIKVEVAQRTLRDRAEAAFNVDAEKKNWLQADGATPLVPFRDLPDAEKELWEAIVVEQETSMRRSSPAKANPATETTK